MKKIILLGDSIRQIGYGKKVPALLGVDYTVWQPAENCRFAQYTLRGMWDWQKELDGADIVHWYNGLWDVCDLFGDGPFTAKEDYVKTMLRVAGILQKKGKKVIFATTTPVHPKREKQTEGMLSTHRNSEIEQYNKAAVELMQRLGIEVNDL